MFLKFSFILAFFCTFITASETYTVSGTVTDSDGAPLSGVILTRDSVMTDILGHYSATSDSGERLTLWLEKREYSFEPVMAYFMATADSVLNFTGYPLPSATVKGRVLYADSLPDSIGLAGVTVILSGADETILTGDDGTFSAIVYPSRDTIYSGSIRMTHPTYFIAPADTDFYGKDTAFNYTPFMAVPKHIFDITCSADANGSISPAGTSSVFENDVFKLTVTPDAGYVVDDVIVDGRSYGAVTAYEFHTVDSVHSVSASFMPAVNTHILRAYGSFTGTGAPDCDSIIVPHGDIEVADGGSITFTIHTPDVPSYYSTSVYTGTGCAAETTYSDFGTYKEFTVSGITSDASVYATLNGPVLLFMYQFHALAFAGGTIEPAGQILWMRDSEKEFTITPDPGYEIDFVCVNGSSIGPVSTYKAPLQNNWDYIKAFFKPADSVAVTVTGCDAVLQDSVVAISWATTFERGNRGFNVQRSTSATGPFTTINDTLIPAAGAGYVYTFEDPVPVYGYTGTVPIFGTAYYRIEQIGIDNSRTYTSAGDLFVPLLLPASVRAGNATNTVYRYPAIIERAQAGNLRDGLYSLTGGRVTESLPAAGCYLFKTDAVFMKVLVVD